MDEPASHVGAATDACVRRVVSQAAFSQKNITIAHRFCTVAGFGKPGVL
jgi:ABC-type transport system involved in cytochrome bd biosynthesis fused ATPase/permease subunit